MEAPTTPILLTKREAAMRVRISERTLERYLAAGTGPVTTRIGTRTLIREDHLRAWIDRCALVPVPLAAAA